MPKMFELIRNGNVPDSVMRSAAHGALAVPPVEMSAIRVYLTAEAEGDIVEEAHKSLARWDDRSLQTIVANPGTSDEVLSYFTDFDHFRESLLPHLLKNQSVSEEMIVKLASRAPTALLSKMLEDPRTLKSSAILNAIKLNLQLAPEDETKVEGALTSLEEKERGTQEEAPAGAPKEGPAKGTVVDFDTELDAALEQVVALYARAHAAEIEEEEGKPFQLVEEPEAEAPAPAVADEIPDEEFTEEEKAVLAEAQKAAAAAEAAAAKAADHTKESVYKKIASLSVGQRVELALKGKKEERMVLIRDGARVVSSAVLDSPKLTEPEVETFASMKNVSEIVLRVIASRRNFMRNYTVHKNLVTNPRLPLDLGLTLVKGLMLGDLRALTTNKNISDVLRKVAVKLYRQRSRQG